MCYIFVFKNIEKSNIVSLLSIRKKRSFFFGFKLIKRTNLFVFESNPNEN